MMLEYRSAFTIDPFSKNSIRTGPCASKKRVIMTLSTDVFMCTYISTVNLYVSKLKMLVHWLCVAETHLITTDNFVGKLVTLFPIPPKILCTHFRAHTPADSHIMNVESIGHKFALNFPSQHEYRKIIRHLTPLSWTDLDIICHPLRKKA